MWKKEFDVSGKKGEGNLRERERGFEGGNGPRKYGGWYVLEEEYWRRFFFGLVWVQVYNFFFLALLFFSGLLNFFFKGKMKFLIRKGEIDLLIYEIGGDVNITTLSPAALLFC